MKITLRQGIAVAAFGLAPLVTAACGDDNGTDPEPTGEAILSGNISTSRTLHSDTVYTLFGFVKVTNGAVLTIEPGTKIVGDVATVGSALFILRGARIEANGTAANPIVFTSAHEGTTADPRRPGDWGGLILVGNATVNRSAVGGVGVIVEGSNAGGIQNGGNPGVTYSEGTTDTDNSGTLRYVRVEFAGYGVAANQELNSFTFAAVGSGTTLEYLQALNGLDDSFEWFGGTVNAKYLVSYNAGDDHFDAAEGFRGRNQFLIALQDGLLTPRSGAGGNATDQSGFEIDGCNGTGCQLLEESTPFTMPVFANFTVVGPGPGKFDDASEGIGAVIRRGTGGVWVNGIMARWRLGLSVRDATTNARRIADSLNFQNILYVQNEATLDPAAGNFTQPANFATSVLDSLSATGSAHLQFVGLTATGTQPSAASIDWSLSATSAARTGGMATFSGRIAARTGTFIVGTSYRGAADPNGPKWWQGWTSYALQ